MDVKDIRPLLDLLDDNLDNLEDALEPILKSGVTVGSDGGDISELAGTLPLLDKAKLYVLVAYALESLIFSSLKLNDKDPRSHPVFSELLRVKQYFQKIETAEKRAGKGSTAATPAAAGTTGVIGNGEPMANEAAARIVPPAGDDRPEHQKVDKQAALRFLKSDLGDNPELKSKLAEQLAKERAKSSLLQAVAKRKAPQAKERPTATTVTDAASAAAAASSLASLSVSGDTAQGSVTKGDPKVDGEGEEKQGSSSESESESSEEEGDDDEESDDEDTDADGAQGPHDGNDGDPHDEEDDSSEDGEVDEDDDTEMKDAADSIFRDLGTEARTKDASQTQQQPRQELEGGETYSSKEEGEASSSEEGEALESAPAQPQPPPPRLSNTPKPPSNPKIKLEPQDDGLPKNIPTESPKKSIKAKYRKHRQEWNARLDAQELQQKVAKLERKVEQEKAAKQAWDAELETQVALAIAKKPKKKEAAVRRRVMKRILREEEERVIGVGLAKEARMMRTEEAKMERRWMREEREDGAVMFGGVVPKKKDKRLSKKQRAKIRRVEKRGGEMGGEGGVAGLGATAGDGGGFEGVNGFGDIGCGASGGGAFGGAPGVDVGAANGGGGGDGANGNGSTKPKSNAYDATPGASFAVPEGDWKPAVKRKRGSGNKDGPKANAKIGEVGMMYN